MTETQIELLKQTLGKEVELVCTDGEVLQVHVISVSETERDVVYDLISSNMMSRYVGTAGNASHLTSFAEINSIRIL